jgi:hypothetical protein
MQNKANCQGRDCFPCLRRGRLAALLAMTGTGEQPIVQNKANLQMRKAMLTAS